MKTAKLDFYNCVRLLGKCADNELIMRDPNNKNNIIVYFGADESNPEGWYSVNIFEAAWELHANVDGQQMLMNALFEKAGIRFKTEALIERE